MNRRREQGGFGCSLRVAVVGPVAWPTGSWVQSVTCSPRTPRAASASGEVRQAERGAGYGDTLKELRRASARSQLRLGRVLEHLAIVDVTDDEVDHALDIA